MFILPEVAFIIQLINFRQSIFWQIWSTCL